MTQAAGPPREPSEAAINAALYVDRAHRESSGPHNDRLRVREMWRAIQSVDADREAGRPEPMHLWYVGQDAAFVCGITPKESGHFSTELDVVTCLACLRTAVGTRGLTLETLRAAVRDVDADLYGKQTAARVHSDEYAEKLLARLAVVR